jgi:putative endonuclease
VVAIALQSWVLRRLHALANRKQSNPASTAHLATGEHGEFEALLHLRELGFTVVARRWKSAKLWGDIDLVAWEGSRLCFIEVKTRTRRDIALAEAAVDHDKQRMLQRMARAYLRTFPEKLRDTVPVRFDVLSIYLLPSGTEFELYRDAFGWR